MVRVEVKKKTVKTITAGAFKEIDNGSCLILKAARRRNSERRRLGITVGR
jgi:hypothetical protein